MEGDAAAASTELAPATVASAASVAGTVDGELRALKLQQPSTQASVEAETVHWQKGRRQKKRAYITASLVKASHKISQFVGSQ